MATLTYTRPSTVAPVDRPTFNASAGGDKIAPNDLGFIVVANNSGAAIAVTIAYPGNNEYGRANPDMAYSIDAAAAKPIGPFPIKLADPSDGLVAITYSAVTSVSLQAYSL